jgi:AraC-like DNA-binding protein
MKLGSMPFTSVFQPGGSSADVGAGARAIGPPAHLARAEELQAVASSILVPLRVTARTDADFRVRVDSARAGPVIVARIRGTAHHVAREASRITSADDDLLKVTLHRNGTADVAQDDRRHRAGLNDLVVFDTLRPYELSVARGCDVVVVGLPRAMLGASAELISRHRVAMPQPCDSGTHAVIAAFLSGLADHIDGLPGPSGIHLADALTSLIVSVFAETSPERVEATTDLADRILAYALANLGDPDLSVESVARRHGISARYLHKLLRPRGLTFAAWVRHERLARIHRDLQDPRLTRRTASVIAARWGVCDAGHLSRALKREYGLTAAEIRRMTRPGEQDRRPLGRPSPGEFALDAPVPRFPDPWTPRSERATRTSQSDE